MKLTNEQRHTRIDDIAAVGDELAEEQMRLVSGSTGFGTLSGGYAPVYTDGWRIDGTCTDPVLPGSWEVAEQ
jgi:hypothetical protein